MSAPQRQKMQSGFGWFVAPFGVLALAAVVLALRWDAIPPSWVIHWGANGQPDGWASKTVLGVFGPLMFGAVLLGVVSATAAFTRSRASVASGEHMGAAIFRLVQTFAIGMATIFAGLAIALPLSTGIHVGVVLASALMVVGVAAGVGIVGYRRAIVAGQTSGEITLPKGYSALYYSNAEDPRLWVPKIGGVGQTINFAHKRAWPMMALLLLTPLTGVAVAAFAALR